MIEIQNLSKSYGIGGKDILNNINLRFEPGQTYGIVGANGSGKTTFFKCILGISEYRGKIVSTLEPLKNNIGYLETEPFFLKKITGKEYLRLLANSRNIKNIDFKEYNIFGLPLDQYCSIYSTGMKKKLALTGVLIQRNMVFILDEPFNGVDLYGNLMIKSIIKKLKSLNKIVVISSHIFSSLTEVCDVLYHLKEGKIGKKILKDDFSLFEKGINEVSTDSIINKLKL